MCNGCRIYGQVKDCILSPGVTVEAGAVVTDSILLPESSVGAGAVITRTIVNEGAAVGAGARIGREDKITVVGDGSTMEV